MRMNIYIFDATKCTVTEMYKTHYFHVEICRVWGDNIRKMNITFFPCRNANDNNIISCKIRNSGSDTLSDNIIFFV